MVDTVTKAFDLADEYRMPAVILQTGLLGQMMEPVAFEDTEIKMSDASKEAVGGLRSRQQEKAQHNQLSLFKARSV